MSIILIIVLKQQQESSRQHNMEHFGELGDIGEVRCMNRKPQCSAFCDKVYFKM